MENEIPLPPFFSAEIGGDVSRKSRKSMRRACSRPGGVFVAALGVLSAAELPLAGPLPLLKMAACGCIAAAPDVQDGSWR